MRGILFNMHSISGEVLTSAYVSTQRNAGLHCHVTHNQVKLGVSHNQWVHMFAIYILCEKGKFMYVHKVKSYISTNYLTWLFIINAPPKERSIGKKGILVNSS